MWGLIQPVAGAVADRYGPAKILIVGIVVLAVGMALTPLMTSGLGLIVSLGILSAIGSGAGSFSVLIGAASQHLTAPERGKAAGIINAGGSLGQFVFAPVAQTLIQTLGWMGAMWSLAALTVGALPLVRVVSPPALPNQRAAAARIGAMAGHAGRDEQSQLFIAPRRILYVRIPHRVPRDASAGRSEPLRSAAESGELVARPHRSRKHCRQPDRRCLHAALSQQISSWPRCTVHARR